MQRDIRHYRSDFLCQQMRYFILKHLSSARVQKLCSTGKCAKDAIYIYAIFFSCGKINIFEADNIQKSNYKSVTFSEKINQFQPCSFTLSDILPSFHQNSVFIYHS